MYKKVACPEWLCLYAILLFNLIWYLYDRLKENGKHSSVAQIAVICKMVVIVFSLFKTKVRYDIERFARTGTEEKAA